MSILSLKNIGYTLFSFVFLLTFNPGCKTKKPVVKKEPVSESAKGYQYVGLKNTAFFWNDRERPELIVWQRRNNEWKDSGGNYHAIDNVEVFQGNFLVSSFQVNENNLMLGSVFIEKNIYGYIVREDHLFEPTDFLNNTLGIDRYHPHTSNYFGFFIANTWSEKTCYPDGRIKKLKYHTYTYSDSVTTCWNSEGVITSLENREGLYEYYENGVLRHITLKDRANTNINYFRNGSIERKEKDTSILRNEVHEICAYSDNGTLRSVHYFLDGEPCHIWREYNPDGTLLRKVNKKQLKILKIICCLDPGLEHDKIYTYVMQNACPVKWHEFFEDYMERSISPILNGRGLKGEYKIKFNVMTDGKVNFVAFNGYNSTGISSDIRNIINNMNDTCPWRPFRRNGVPVNSEHEFIFKVL